MKNKEITMYELMGLIKDGKAPIEIKYDGKIYRYNNGDYIDEYFNSLFDKILEKYDMYTILTEQEVEILPEENDEQHIKMQFPDTFEEFIKSYSFIDDKEIYTNGSELIPTFRLQQWIEHKKEENDEWEDIEELCILKTHEYNTTTVQANRIAINKLIKNQRKIIEKLESKDEKD